MGQPTRTSRRQATLSVLGLVAIPFGTVSITALLAGPISSADPVSLVATVCATLIGAAIGLLIVHLVRLTSNAIRTAAISAIDWVEADSTVTVITPLCVFVVITAPVHSTPHHVAAIPRRGPPSGL